MSDWGGVFYLLLFKLLTLTLGITLTPPLLSQSSGFVILPTICVPSVADFCSKVLPREIRICEENWTREIFLHSGSSVCTSFVIFIFLHKPVYFCRHFLYRLTPIRSAELALSKNSAPNLIPLGASQLCIVFWSRLFSQYPSQGPDTMVGFAPKRQHTLTVVLYCMLLLYCTDWSFFLWQDRPGSLPGGTRCWPRFGNPWRNFRNPPLTKAVCRGGGRREGGPQTLRYSATAPHGRRGRG